MLDALRRLARPRKGAPRRGAVDPRALLVAGQVTVVLLAQLLLVPPERRPLLLRHLGPLAREQLDQLVVGQGGMLPLQLRPTVVREEEEGGGRFFGRVGVLFALFCTMSSN